MQTKRSVLTQRQEKAIEGLLCTNTRAEAAEYAGCSERVIYKYLRDPLFKGVLLERENELRRDVGRRLSKDAGTALDVIYEIMTSEQIEAGIRLRAADLWLKNFISTYDQEDLEARISVLEARLLHEHD
jgi:hypothetical protein